MPVSASWATVIGKWYVVYRWATEGAIWFRSSLRELLHSLSVNNAGHRKLVKAAILHSIVTTLTNANPYMCHAAPQGACSS